MLDLTSKCTTGDESCDFYTLSRSDRAKIIASYHPEIAEYYKSYGTEAMAKIEHFVAVCSEMKKISAEDMKHHADAIMEFDKKLLDQGKVRGSIECDC